MSRTKEEEKAIGKIMADVSKKFMDQGLPIEAGWQSLAAVALPEGVSEIQRSETRKAFFAGAIHLLDLLIGDPSGDPLPTQVDIDQMRLIIKEMAKFHQSINKEFWS